MSTLIPAIIFVAILFYLLEMVIRGVGKVFGLYDIVKEKEAVVYVLFGEIVGVLDTPGLHFLWIELGWKAFFVKWLGRTYKRSLSLDQKYLRSIPVNSGEGTPMGIGVWYEMFITDPVGHIFRNVDPEGSLTVNVKNATIKNLSNLPLSEMLINRHTMSRAVREDVSPESQEWGYQLGSVYIRKVHFRDENMIRQIEEKVVNQLRQVTSAIEQDGVNQVNIIASRANQEASVEFAKASAVRPKVIGEALQKISKDPEVMSTMFDVLEYQKMIDSNADITLIPEGSRGDMMTQLLSTRDKRTDK